MNLLILVIGGVLAVVVLLAIFKFALKLVVIGVVVVAALAFFAMVRNKIGGGGAR